VPVTMELNLTFIGTLISVVIGFATVFTLVRRNLVAGTRDNAQAIAALRDTCESLSRRLLKVESDLSYVPSTQKFNELSERVVSMTTELNSVAKTVDATQKSIRRVETFLIKKGMEE